MATKRCTARALNTGICSEKWKIPDIKRFPVFGSKIYSMVHALGPKLKSRYWEEPVLGGLTVL